MVCLSSHGVVCNQLLATKIPATAITKTSSFPLGIVPMWHCTRYVGYIDLLLGQLGLSPVIPYAGIADILDSKSSAGECSISPHYTVPT